jgi:hypothetical protein
MLLHNHANDMAAAGKNAENLKVMKAPQPVSFAQSMLAINKLIVKDKLTAVAGSLPQTNSPNVFKTHRPQTQTPPHIQKYNSNS